MKSIPPAVAPPPPSVPAPKSLPPPPPPPSPAEASGDGWDDDDKTEVYGRSAGQDAVRRLLGTTTPRTSGVPDVPPPPMSRPTAPVPTPPLAAARRAAIVAEQLEPKSVPPAPSQNRTPLILAAVAFCALLATLFFVLWPSTGALVVTVAGPGNRPIDGVQVLVNDKVVCEGSTCHLDLPAGTHYVQARAAGYQDFAKTAVNITSGEDAVRNIQLLPASGTGIRVKAEGTGLKLFVDGREIGPLPQELKELSPGEHQVKVAGEHFETWKQKVEVKADEMQTLGPLKLKVLKGLAMIKDGGSADGARIVLQSGADRRILPSLPINLHIDTTKPHTLIATKAGFETFKQDLEFEDGQAERTFEISLEPLPEAAKEAERPSTRGNRAPRPSAPAVKEATSGKATLSFNTIPASKIILNGKPLGNTPKVGVSVGAGRHSVTFLSDGKRVSKSVRVGAGESKTVTHRF